MSEECPQRHDGKLLYCSFCGEESHEVRKLIAARRVRLRRCVELCNDIIREELEGPRRRARDKLPKPHEIKKSSTSTSSARRAKKSSVAVYNHTSVCNPHRLAAQDEVEIAEQYLLIRPDRLPQDAARGDAGAAAERTVHHCGRDTLTEAGYVGGDVENIIQKLLQKWRLRRREAQTGIVYIDEIARSRASRTTRRSPATSRAKACSSAAEAHRGHDCLGGPAGRRPSAPHSSCRSTPAISCHLRWRLRRPEKIIPEPHPEERHRISPPRCATFNHRPHGSDLFHDVEPEDLIKYGLTRNSWGVCRWWRRSMSSMTGARLDPHRGPRTPDQAVPALFEMEGCGPRVP